MNLDFSEIQEIQKLISVSEFENLFDTIENKAFELRGRSTDFYTYLNELFKKESIDKSVKVMLLKYLTIYKGNWKHDFLRGLYESLKEPEPNQENNFNISDTDFELVNSLVSVKVEELNAFNYDVYNIEGNEVTRLIYETQKITDYLNKQGFKEEFRSAYLELLKAEINSNNIDIRDGSYHNWQSITNDFSIWIGNQLIDIKLKERGKKTVPNENQHPAIFENEAFNDFVKWVNNSDDEQDKSISFIFQKLKKENKLRNTTFKVLSEWAFNNNYLDEENYNKLLANGCFISPSKILTKLRLVLYNSIIGD